jgi:hypothetical protein
MHPEIHAVMSRTLVFMANSAAPPNKWCYITLMQSNRGIERVSGAYQNDMELAQSAFEAISGSCRVGTSQV